MGPCEAARLLCVLLAPSTTTSANAPSEHSIHIMGKAKKAQRAPKRARRGRKASSKQTRAQATKAGETKDEKEVELYFPFPMDIVERILCKFQDVDARLLGKGVLLLRVVRGQPACGLRRVFWCVSSHVLPFRLYLQAVWSPSSWRRQSPTHGSECA